MTVGVEVSFLAYHMDGREPGFSVSMQVVYHLTLASDTPLEYPSLRPSKFKAFVRGLGAPRLMDLLDHPGKDTPKLIAAWIRSSCGPDAVEQSEACRRRHGGAKKGTANSWPQAQKMRSSVSHFFAIDQERGTRPFTEREDRSWTGNPSLSDFVAKLEARQGTSWRDLRKRQSNNISAVRAPPNRKCLEQGAVRERCCC
jgi:hypothetical protein